MQAQWRWRKPPLPCSSHELHRIRVEREVVKGLQIACVGDKWGKPLVTDKFAETLIEELLPPQIAHQGKTRAHHLTFAPPLSGCTSPTAPTVYWANEESVSEYGLTIIVPYNQSNQEELQLGCWQRPLVVFDWFTTQISQHCIH